MALKPGDALLNGRYRIVRQLGPGGRRHVYLAEDTLLQRDVAIKELVTALVEDEATLKRLLGEAEASVKLRHEQIVATYDVLTEVDSAGETRHFVVLEYMAGGSLSDLLRVRASLPVADAVRIAADVCEGLSYAHERGIVHCALKPASILFTGDAPGSARGTAKVAGFGIAAVSDTMLTRLWPAPDGFAAGTLAYMSPERTEGLRRDPRIDIYSLGTLLYRILTGLCYLDFDEQPVVAATGRNVELIRKEKPTRPSDHVPRVPGWLDAVVLKAVAKRPKDRFRDASEFGAALCTSGEAPEPKTAAAAPRRLRLWPLAVGALLIAALFALVAGGIEFVPGWIDDWQQASTAEAATAIVALQASQTASVAETRAAIPTATPTPPSLTPTATPSPPPTATQMPTPTPTRTASPVPTDTPAPTDTAVPPTATFTPLPPTVTNTSPPPPPPPPTFTPAPPPTPTPRPLLSAPVPLEPGEAAVFAHGSEFYLHWSWNGEPAAGEYFDVRVWLDEQPHYGIGWTKDHRYRLSSNDLSNLFHDAACGAALNWAIAVVEGQDGVLWEERSPESSPRAFYVEFAHCR